MLQQRTPTIQDAYELFLLDAQARNLAPNTLHTYKTKLVTFRRWCDAQNIACLEDVTPIALRHFLVHLQKQDLSSRSRYNIAKAVQTLFNYCLRDELLETSPFAKVQLPKLEKKILPAFTPGEIKDILKACRTQRDATICIFLLDSGLRASELLALDGEDIDLQTGVVTVMSFYVRYCSSR